MKIAIDVMGGDNAPLAPVQGGVLAAKAYGEEVILVGPEERIYSILKEQGAENTPGLSMSMPPMWWVCTTTRQPCCVRSPKARWLLPSNW